MCFCNENLITSGFGAELMEHYKSKYTFQFTVHSDYKFISVLKCEVCNTSWILDKLSENNFHTRLHSKYQIDLLYEWLNHNLSAKHLQKDADLIGTSSKQYYEVPCKAELIDGKIIDYCILTKWSFHPKISWFSLPISKFIYADQVKKIVPSQNSIGLKHRISMRSATETILRDFAKSNFVPLNLIVNEEIYFQTEGCKTYYFDSNFLNFKDYKGCDIKEINQDVITYKNYSKQDDLSNKITLIMFDEF